MTITSIKRILHAYNSGQMSFSKHLFNFASIVLFFTIDYNDGSERINLFKPENCSLMILMMILITSNSIYRHRVLSDAPLCEMIGGNWLPPIRRTSSQTFNDLLLENAVGSSINLENTFACTNTTIPDRRSQAISDFKFFDVMHRLGIDG